MLIKPGFVGRIGGSSSALMVTLWHVLNVAGGTDITSPKVKDASGSVVVSSASILDINGNQVVVQ